MLSKRFFLIAGGTVGGLGAVLAITPPQFGSTSGLALGSGTALAGGSTSLSGGTTSLAGGTTSSGTTSTPAATPAPTTTKKTTTKATHKATPKSTKKSTSGSTSGSASSGGTTSTPAATPSTTPKAAGISGTFTGAAGNTRYGPVQVQITVVNNVITGATALTYPTGSFRDQQINQQAIPYLIQETLAAQSANIQGVGGASYTSQGWVNSLQSALAKAGL